MSAVATAAPISIEPRKADRLYALPAPTTTGERSRLNTQHRALFLTHGSLYSAPEHVERMLAPGQAHTPIIADVGCGSGAWSLDMAQIFPHAEVIGMDINPPSVDADTPPNCKFVTHDANDDFTEYKNMFSVVHMRAIDAGVRDYKQLLDKVAQTLIPGGVLLLSSGQLVLYSENKTPMPFVEEGQEGWTAVQTILGHQERCLREQGCKTRASSTWEMWLNASPFYSDVGAQVDYLPIGPWRAESRWKEIGNFMQTDTLRLLEFLKNNLLRTSDLDPDTLERWHSMAQAEVKETKHRVYCRWPYAWATRTAVEWHPTTKA